MSWETKKDYAGIAGDLLKVKAARLTLCGIGVFVRRHLDLIGLIKPVGNISGQFVIRRFGHALLLRRSLFRLLRL